MKIILNDDFLYKAVDYKTKKLLIYQKVFYPYIKSVVSEDVVITYDIKDKNGNLFNREYFYKLNDKDDLKQTYNSYNIKEFNQKQIDYLSQFFYEDTLYIGFELYSNFADLLSSFGCKVIDMAYHPYKLFNDLAFGFYSNDIDIYNQIMKYKIPRDKFQYYTYYWKVFMECNGMIQDEDLEENSALFIGQTLLDKSVDFNGKFLNVTDYEEKLKELNKEYSKIYYLPHPYLGKHRKMIYDWVKKSPYIELITGRNTYGLIASDKIKKVIGISTSVLYEAQYFDKEIEYLFKPLFNIDVDFNDHCYVSIVSDYWNPKFWADILSPVVKIKQNVKNVNYFENNQNMMRNIINSYWGYAQLDPIKRIPNIEQSIKNIFMKYIAPKI